MEIRQCNRNPFFLANFAYDGKFSDGNSFCLRIPERDVVEFASALLQAYKDDAEGKVKATPPHVHITENGNVFHDGKVEQIKNDKMDDAVEKLQAVAKSFNDMFHNGCSYKIKIVNPAGYLKHEPTGYTISVYKPISQFKAFMLNWCFGLKYKKI